MKERCLILILLLSVNFLNAQDTNYDNPSALINGYLAAVSDDNDSTRQALLNKLFSEEGLISATIQKDASRALQQFGPIDRFLKNSAEFYSNYDVDYQELERSIDYYQDLAMIHSLVFQVIEEKSGAKTKYEQLLWFSFNMNYADDRWYLTSVSSINAIDAQPIEGAMLQDTLWHNPEP